MMMVILVITMMMRLKIKLKCNDLVFVPGACKRSTVSVATRMAS